MKLLVELLCFLIIVFLLAASPTLASDKLISIGDEPPPISLELLQAPGNKRFESASLKGKLTLLEFWSTSCGPCIAAIPHINSLSEQLKDLPVQIISVTPDSKEKLDAFLKKRSISSWIGVDPDDKLKSSFGLDAIPAAVLIDIKGKVAAVLSPEDLNLDELRAMAQGQPAPSNMQKNCFRTMQFFSALSRNDSSTSKSVSLQKPLFQISIAPSVATETGSSSRWSDKDLDFKNASLMQLVSMAYSTASCRMVVNGKVPELKYDVSIVCPGANKNSGALFALESGLKEAFSLKSKWEPERHPVLLLEKIPNSKLQLTPTASAGAKCRNNSGKGYEFVNYTLDEVAQTLEGDLNVPILTSNLRKDHLDLSITLGSKPDFENVNAGLAPLGLRLRQVEKTIPILKIDLPKLSATALTQKN